MPKSKKNKVVHLTQVKKKGKDHKEDLLKQLEQYVAKFNNVYIFDFDQMKSDRIMNLRVKLKDIGRIYSGKNSLVASMFRTVGNKTNTDYDDLVKQVAGHRGLLFTDVKCNKLMELIDRDAPEFCEKLLGYSRIAPETKLMLVDDDQADNDDADGDGDTAGPVDSSLGDESADKKKKRRKRSKRSISSSEKREVKFVKI